MYSLVSVTNLVGIYTITGYNQDETDITYKGTLNLTLDSNNRIIAKWLINNSQKQFGTGFFKDGGGRVNMAEFVTLVKIQIHIKV